MLILKSNKNLQWGELDLPVWGLEQDWHGETLAKPLMFSLAVDGRYLWFLAAGSTQAQSHPQARPGVFTAELWKYDVAELFLADPSSGRYLEFNLAANGAWWSCEFTAPRQRAEELDIPFPETATFAELSVDGGWMAAMAIPLDLLEARLGFGENTKINVTFIANSPQQQFLSAAKLPGDQPNYHQPDHFSSFQFHALGK